MYMVEMYQLINSLYVVPKMFNKLNCLSPLQL
jgi:hypothetical protein